jgi:hypothetical protein
MAGNCCVQKIITRKGSLASLKKIERKRKLKNHWALFIPLSLGGSNTTQNPLFFVWLGSSHRKNSGFFYSIKQNLQVDGINA